MFRGSELLWFCVFSASACDPAGLRPPVGGLRNLGGSKGNVRKLEVEGIVGRCERQKEEEEGAVGEVLLVL